MNQLISALGQRLAGIYGESSVYFGDAEQDVTYPYIVYSIQGSGMTEYNACNRNIGAVTSTAVQISTWTKSSVAAGDMLAAIIASIDGTKLSMSTDIMLRADKIEEAVFVEPDREQDGQRVWQGIVIYEFLISKGE